MWQVSKQVSATSDLPDLPESLSGCIEPVCASAELLAEERDLATGVSERRLQQLASGRHVARSALELNGAVAAPILKHASGAPAWPTGVVGSISHTPNLAGALVANASVHASVGLDLERAGRVSERVATRVLTPEEIERLQDWQLATVMFSAKEAGYKAVHPLVGRYIAFQEAEVDISLDSHSFTIRYVGEHRANAILETGTGLFGEIEGHVVTAFWIPNLGGGGS